MKDSLFYSIRHQTRYRYNKPITESVMKIYMQPRSEGPQRCLEFQVHTDPSSMPTHSRDYYGNTFHHFNIPSRHTSLTITTEALVQISPMEPIPDTLSPDAWRELDEMTATDKYWFMLEASYFTQASSLLYRYAHEIHLSRDSDPLSTLRSLNTAIYNNFEYVPHSTTVDSPIDDALSQRRGVCQDFAHIMIALVRELGIPCRYVSGYLYHRQEDQDRSEEDATHAWVEALLPGLGWIGFDPTNNLIAAERHIRTSVGRDYGDVPPTLGVYKGETDSELDVGVRVLPTEAPIPEDEELLPTIDWTPSINELQDQDYQQQQQQQQQQ